MMRMSLAVAAACATALLGAATAGAATFNYTKIAGLSAVQYPAIKTEVVRLPMADGAEIYLEITRPDAPGRFPAIFEESPYHGTLYDRTGTRILPEPKDATGKQIGLVGYFPPRGYAVVMADVRGTGRSGGCLDHLGPKDAADFDEIMTWIGTRDWSNGNIGMTGHSYVGSTPITAAAQHNPYLKTIVPSAGLASMYDHQFQNGVPFYLQWLGPIEAYEQLTFERSLPPVEGGDPTGQTHPNGDDWGEAGPNHLAETGCGMTQSAAVGGADNVTGQYGSWHRERDWRTKATSFPGPVFLVHGTNDNAARISNIEWFLERSNPEDKLWIGQWDHGHTTNPLTPNRRQAGQWTYALHAWFDRWLKGSAVATGPGGEAFLNDEATLAAAQVKTGGTEVLTFPSAQTGDGAITFHADATSGALSTTAPAAAGSATFQGSPQGFADASGGKNGQAPGVTFSTEPLTGDFYAFGLPEMTLTAATTGQNTSLIATLYEEYAKTGTRRRITQCTINPLLRNGVDQAEPAVPGERWTGTPQCFTMAHHVRAGDRLVLRVTTADPDKAPFFAADPKVDVGTGPEGTSITLPVVTAPEVSKDTLPNPRTVVYP